MRQLSLIIALFVLLSRAVAADDPTPQPTCTPAPTVTPQPTATPIDFSGLVQVVGTLSAQNDTSAQVSATRWAEAQTAYAESLTVRDAGYQTMTHLTLGQVVCLLSIIVLLVALFVLVSV